jgi:hypothetical protein
MLERSDGPIKERVFIGHTDEQGHYSAKPSWTSDVGIAPGHYRVYIQSVLAEGASESTKAVPDPVPMDYRDGSQTIEVPPGGLTDANFDIASGR